MPEMWGDRQSRIYRERKKVSTPLGGPRKNGYTLLLVTAVIIVLLVLTHVIPS